MYNSHNIATMIKNRAKAKNVVIKTMLEELGLGSNTMSAMYHGKSLASDSLARIADYLECSVDYLLGKTEKPTPENESGLTEEQIHFIERIKTLDSQTIQRLIALADSILGEQHE